MISASVALQVPASAGDGAPSYDLSTFADITVQTAGVTASSLNLLASADGTNFVAIKMTLANGIATLSSLIAAGVTVKYLRVHTVSISGGETPTVTVLAKDTRSDNN